LVFVYREAKTQDLNEDNLDEINVVRAPSRRHSHSYLPDTRLFSVGIVVDCGKSKFPTRRSSPRQFGDDAFLRLTVMVILSYLGRCHLGVLSLVLSLKKRLVVQEMRVCACTPLKVPRSLRIKDLSISSFRLTSFFLPSAVDYHSELMVLLLILLNNFPVVLLSLYILGPACVKGKSRA
jgi:hypothetical protein